jgi:hypothetical protein
MYLFIIFYLFIYFILFIIFFFSVYAQLMSRSQQRLCMLLIPLECFVAVAEEGDMSSFDRTKYPPIHCIYEELSDVWINVSGI